VTRDSNRASADALERLTERRGVEERASQDLLAEEVGHQVGDLRCRHRTSDRGEPVLERLLHLSGAGPPIVDGLLERALDDRVELHG
jgi:hypothetical protein